MTVTCDRPAAAPAIVVRGVGKAFDDGSQRIEALSGIDLTIERGEFVVLLGRSGCGKTTLLRIIGGLADPSTGVVERIATDGEDASDIGFVFQEPNLMPWRRVRENVALPLELRGAPKAARRQRSSELLALVGLAQFERAYPRQLSGGMRQRVAIARALVADPAVLLMDEPFGALDAQTRDSMNVELQRIWLESRKTSVFVTHSIPEAVFLADRVVLLSPQPGRIVEIQRVDFPRPRPMSLHEDPAFLAIVSHLRAQLEA